MSKSKKKFAKLYHEIAFSPAYQHMNGIARAAYNEYLLLYNGSNNGKMFISTRDLADRLSVSVTHAWRAHRDVEEHGLIEVVRKSGFQNKRRAQEVRLTHFKCDATGDMPSHAYRKWNAAKQDEIDAKRKAKEESQRTRGKKMHSSVHEIDSSVHEIPGTDSRPHSSVHEIVAAKSPVHSSVDETHIESSHWQLENSSGVTPDQAPLLNPDHEALARRIASGENIRLESLSLTYRDRVLVRDRAKQLLHHSSTNRPIVTDTGANPYLAQKGR